MILKAIKRIFSPNKVRSVHDQLNTFRSLESSKSLCRILFGPGFNIDETFVAHDRILMNLLKSNADIAYVGGCDLLKSAHPFVGGVWDNTNPLSDLEYLNTNELKAISYHEKVGEIFIMKDFISSEDLIKVDNLANKSKEDHKLIIDGHDFFHQVKNVVRNMAMVSDINLVPNLKMEIYNVSYNFCIYYFLFKKCIESYKPDIIFSHDSFYFPWSILEYLAKKNGITFYSYYNGLYDNTYIYALNKPAMSLSTDSLWDKYKHIGLTEKENLRALDWLEKRKVGDYGLGEKNLTSSSLLKQLENFCLSKPTAILFGNVVWDLAALDKEVVFNSIQQGYIETIQWFINNSEKYNLIIKSHPAETNKQIPVTKERLSNIIKANFVSLPANIKIIDSEDPITAYDLFPIVNLTIVWTTTAGLESVMSGTPTICLAKVHYGNKGFTHDPNSRDEYFKLLEELLPSKHVANSELALRYFYLYYFRFSRDYGIPTMNWRGQDLRLKYDSYEEYLDDPEVKRLLSNILGKREPLDGV